MNQLTTLLWLPVALLAWPLGALAHDDDHNDQGRGGYHQHQRDAKQTFYDGNCTVEQKFKKNGEYKEKRKCHGPHYRVYQAAPTFVPAPIYYGGRPGITINGTYTFPR
jgi:hypothetical protein